MNQYRLTSFYPTPNPRPSPIDRLSVPGLFLGASALLVTEISLHRVVLVSLIYGAAVFLCAPQFFGGALNHYQVWQRKYKVNLAAVVFCLLGTVFFLDLSSAPASAQFFQGAEDFISGALAANAPGAADVIALVFNVLRALMLIYLGVSLIRVVQSARNDEDWQTLARTPLIILIAVVIADILTTFITG